MIAPSADDVKTAIEHAWRDVPYPGDKHVWGDEDYRPEKDAIGDDMRGKHWRDLSPEVLRLHSWKCSLFFMEIVTYHFFLPAFLIAAMTDGEVFEHVGFALSPPEDSNPDPHLIKYFHQRVDCLSEEQKHAVGLWWAYMTSCDELTELDKLPARSSYWKPSVPDGAGLTSESDAETSGTETGPRR